MHFSILLKKKNPFFQFCVILEWKGEIGTVQSRFNEIQEAKLKHIFWGKKGWFKRRSPPQMGNGSTGTLNPPWMTSRETSWWLKVRAGQLRHLTEPGDFSEEGISSGGDGFNGFRLDDHSAACEVWMEPVWRGETSGGWRQRHWDRERQRRRVDQSRLTWRDCRILFPQVLIGRAGRSVAVSHPRAGHFQGDEAVMRRGSMKTRTQQLVIQLWTHQHSHPLETLSFWTSFFCLFFLLMIVDRFLCLFLILIVNQILGFSSYVLKCKAPKVTCPWVNIPFVFKQNHSKCFSIFMFNSGGAGA